jgi:hypothetical protein
VLVQLPHAIWRENGRQDVLHASSVETLANMPADPSPAMADAMGATHGHIADWLASPLHTPISEKRDYQTFPTELEDRLLDYLCPQRKSRARGYRAAFLALLPRPYTWGAVRHWLKGRARMPANVALALADEMQKQIDEGRILADALHAYAAQQAAEQRVSGFCVVGADGRDGRGHWRR